MNINDYRGNGFSTPNPTPEEMQARQLGNLKLMGVPDVWTTPDSYDSNYDPEAID